MVPWWSIRISTGVAVDHGDRMTYEDGGGEHTSKDGEGTSANDIIVEQRSAGLITLNSVLKMDVPVGTRSVSGTGHW